MSTEQKYPAEIVEAVAKAMRLSFFPNLSSTPPEKEWQDAAVAALDAIPGIVITEEWAAESEDSIDIADDEFEARRWVARHEGDLLVRRFTLHAETPWVEVASDGEAE